MIPSYVGMKKTIERRNNLMILNLNTMINGRFVDGRVEVSFIHKVCISTLMVILFKNIVLHVVEYSII